jgi:hypothetical protein
MASVYVNMTARAVVTLAFVSSGFLVRGIRLQPDWYVGSGFSRIGAWDPASTRFDGGDPMRSSFTCCCIAVVCCGALGLESARAQPTPAAGADALGWMAGCWAFERDGRQVQEHWMRPAGGVMLGMSRTVRSGAARSLEFVVLRNTADGVVYEAHPLEQKPTSFRMTRLSAQEAVFENPAHDFPQRIIYRREGDRLLARIEGPQGGELKGIDYPYEKVACP